MVESPVRPHDRSRDSPHTDLRESPCEIVDVREHRERTLQGGDVGRRREKRVAGPLQHQIACDCSGRIRRRPRGASGEPAVDQAVRRRPRREQLHRRRGDQRLGFVATEDRTACRRRPTGTRRYRCRRGSAPCAPRAGYRRPARRARPAPGAATAQPRSARGSRPPMATSGTLRLTTRRRRPTPPIPRAEGWRRRVRASPAIAEHVGR